MNRTKRQILCLFLVLALLAISASVVFAKELGALTISGPGIKGELTLKDRDAMLNLEKSGFFDQTASITPPENLGEGYNITTQLNLDGKMVPFVQMVYYPTNEGKPGFIHYTGRLDGETLQPDDRWQTLSLSADKAFRSLMTANNITLQSALIAAPAAKEPAVKAPAAEPVTAPAASTATIEPSYIIPVVIVAILLLVSAGLVLRRRTVSHPST